MKSIYKLGELIRNVDVKNEDLHCNNLKGLSMTKEFRASTSNIVGTDLSKYKIVAYKQFACDFMSAIRVHKMPIAFNTEAEEILVSPAYAVFEVVDENISLPEYLMMWFRRSEFDRYADFRSDAAIRGGYGWNELCETEIKLPSLDEQKKIVFEYRTVVDRITLKKQINDNLSTQIDSIFRQWFVEFKSPYSNSKRYISEFGELPLGWQVDELGNYIESFSKTHSFNKDELIFLNTSDILAGDFLCDNYMPVSEMPGQAKKQIQKGDILFSEIRPANKRYALVTFSADDYVVSTKLMVLRTTQEKLTNLRIYHYLTMEKTLEDLHREADGKSGTFPQITFDENLRHRKFVVADDVTEYQFNKLLENYYKLENTNRKEIASLRNMASSILSSLNR